MERGGGAHHIGGGAEEGQLRPGGGVAYQPGGPQQHQEGPGGQRGVEDVLAQAAGQALDHYNGEYAAHRRQPVGGSGGEGEGQQQPGDGGGAVRNRAGGLGDGPEGPLGGHAGGHAHQG